MDPDRERETPPPDPTQHPADVQVLPTAEPEAEFVPAYAEWRLDNPEQPR